MSVVFIYGFSGQYSGSSEYEWSHPHPGVTQKCMLFLRQEADLDAYPDAQAECERYGFSAIRFSGCGQLQIEVLNTDAYRGFSRFYEEALSNGSALLYYPNQAAQ